MTYTHENSNKYYCELKLLKLDSLQLGFEDGCNFDYDLKPGLSANYYNFNFKMSKACKQNIKLNKSRNFHQGTLVTTDSTIKKKSEYKKKNKSYKI